METAETRRWSGWLPGYGSVHAECEPLVDGLFATRFVTGFLDRPGEPVALLAEERSLVVDLCTLGTRLMHEDAGDAALFGAVSSAAVRELREAARHSGAAAREERRTFAGVLRHRVARRLLSHGLRAWARPGGHGAAAERVLFEIVTASARGERPGYFVLASAMHAYRTMRRRPAPGGAVVACVLAELERWAAARWGVARASHSPVPSRSPGLATLLASANGETVLVRAERLWFLSPDPERRVSATIEVGGRTAAKTRLTADQLARVLAALRVALVAPRPRWAAVRGALRAFAEAGADAAAIAHLEAAVVRQAAERR